MKQQPNPDRTEGLFRDKLENLEVKPSDKVWDGIAGKLPSSRPPLFNVIRYAVRIAAVLLLGTGGYAVYYLIINPPQEKLKVAQKQIKIETQLPSPRYGNMQKENSNKKRVTNAEEITPIERISPIEKPIASQKLQQFAQSPETGQIPELIAINELDKKLLERIPSYSLSVLENDTVVLKNIEMTKQPGIEEYIRNKMISIQGFHAGIIYKYNTTWILNQNTYGNFDKYELAYKLTWGASYGISLGYDFSTTFGVQTELIFNSNQGQKYEDIIKRKRVSREVALQYSQMQVLLKYKVSRLVGVNMKPMVINYLLGCSYASIKSATETIDNNTINIKDRFNDKDYAVVFGLEYDIFLNKRIFASLGGRSSISIMNINANDWNVHGTYKASHNITLGVTGGINYLIGK